jgi:hypothetical protein
MPSRREDPGLKRARRQQGRMKAAASSAEWGRGSSYCITRAVSLQTRQSWLGLGQGFEALPFRKTLFSVLSQREKENRKHMLGRGV